MEWNQPDKQIKILVCLQTHWSNPVVAIKTATK